MSFEPVDLGDPELNRAVNFALAEADTSEPAWWWLSFCNPALPTGTQFMGACIVLAPNAGMAIKRAWELGINPGGEVGIGGPLTEDQMPVNYPRNTLMDRDLIARLDA